MPRFPSLSLDWSPCSLSSSQTSWWCILRRLFCQPWRLPVKRMMTRVHWAWLRNPWIAQELGNPWIARAKHRSILWAAQSMDCPDPGFAHNKFMSVHPSCTCRCRVLMYMYMYTVTFELLCCEDIAILLDYVKLHVHVFTTSLQTVYHMVTYIVYVIWVSLSEPHTW